MYAFFHGKSLFLVIRLSSQLDPADWHAVIGDATVGDAICDRLVHGAHRLTLHGESLRKVKPPLTPEPKSKI